MDNPAEVLYWTLRHGQRLQIAQQFGGWRASDQHLGELPAARVWLRRLARSGSLAPAMERARQLHRNELRQLEDVIRRAGAVSWRAELEHWRDHHYRLLAMAAPGDQGAEHAAVAAAS